MDSKSVSPELKDFQKRWRDEIAEDKAEKISREETTLPTSSEAVWSAAESDSAVKSGSANAEWSAVEWSKAKWSSARTSRKGGTDSECRRCWGECTCVWYKETRWRLKASKTQWTTWQDVKSDGYQGRDEDEVEVKMTNLPYGVSKQEIVDACLIDGINLVKSVCLPTNRDFGFLRLETAEEASRLLAMTASINGKKTNMKLHEKPVIPKTPAPTRPPPIFEEDKDKPWEKQPGYYGKWW